jgi:hypothetical protein
MIAVVMSLTGLSPLQNGGNDPAAAKGCVTVSEPTWITRSTLVLGEDGQLRVRDRRTKYYRQVTRCPGARDAP